MPVNGDGKKKILLLGEAPGCLGGESLIDVAFRDKSKYPDGIPIKSLVGKSDFYVYSFDVRRQELAMGKVKRVWKTGRKKVYRITYEWKYARGAKVVFLRNSILATGNHLFLLKRYRRHDPFKGIQEDVDYLSIDIGLQVGHSIQPFHRHNQEYALIGAFGNRLIKESRFLLAHKVGRPLKSREQCHHVNENKLDDREENLELHSIEGHARLHTIARNPMDNPVHRRRHRRVMNSSGYRAAQSKKMKEVLSDPDTYKARLKQIKKSAQKISRTLKDKYKEPEFYYRYLLTRQKLYGWSDFRVRIAFQAKFPGQPLPDDNHKIVSIEFVGVQDVYDMEVEDHHNFAVNGVFVHNSTEDDEGKPFIGPAGKLLDNTLSQFDVDMVRDCWITNSLICFPWEERYGSKHHRTPTDKEISYCRPNVIKTVKELQPDIIIPLGKVAVQSLIGWLWKEDVGLISRWVGWQIPHVGLNAWICPTWHPSAILRQENGRDEPVQKLLWERHLKAACKLDGRPYFQLPDYRSRIKVILNADEAIEELRYFEKQGKPIAWDLETTTLKPDGEQARIICCSVSDGDWSVAFPWHGKAIRWMRRLLRSDLPKIGFNTKFETRWVRRVLGHGVRNWVFDGMLSAHVLDNRPHVCSLKFQAFVRLGVDSYDDQVKPYLQSEGSNISNRIDEVPLDKLLYYCGMDSMLEWHVAQKQAKQLGIDLCSMKKS